MGLVEQPYPHDEKLIESAVASGRPLASVYRYPDTAVSIGRGGKTELELHPDAIAEDGVPLLRRRGGGCAVVLDPGMLVVSVALPLPGIGGISTAFDRISSWLSERLANCGVPGVEQRGVSDLCLGDRKIGGSCVWRTRGLLYYSTTLLVDHDRALFDRYLPHPPREPEYRAGRPHGDFTTSLAAAGVLDDPDLLLSRLNREIPPTLDALMEKAAAPRCCAPPPPDSEE